MCYQSVLKSTTRTESNQEQQQTHRLATLLFLCSMMVDEHIRIFPLLSDCRPENLYIKWKRRRLLQASWSLVHPTTRMRLLKNRSPLPKSNQNGIIFKRADPSLTQPKGPSLELVHLEFLKSSWNHLEIFSKSSTFKLVDPLLIRSEDPSLKM